MKVRIKQASNYDYWYNSKVGIEFEVEECNSYDVEKYRVIDGQAPSYHLIDKSDCEPVTDPVKIPFTFELWDKDRTQKVWTRDGREVKELTFFTSGEPYKFAGIVKNDFETWTKDGKYFEDQVFENELDLFLEHTEREYFVNVYKHTVGAIHTGDVYTTLEEAEKIGKANSIYLKTINFTA